VEKKRLSALNDVLYLVLGEGFSYLGESELHLSLNMKNERESWYEALERVKGKESYTNPSLFFFFFHSGKKKVFM